jgi:positive regulator of sigma E activity
LELKSKPARQLADFLWHSPGCLLAGAIFADDAGRAALYAVMGAIAGLVFGVLWLKGHNAESSRYGRRYQPVILRAGNGDEINLNYKEVNE